jgi:hypothetical protein
MNLLQGTVAWFEMLGTLMCGSAASRARRELITRLAIAASAPRNTACSMPARRMPLQVGGWCFGSAAFIAHRDIDTRLSKSSALTDFLRDGIDVVNRTGWAYVASGLRTFWYARRRLGGSPPKE